MDLLNGPSDPIAFQPRGDEGPTYFLRQPLVRDRGRLQIAVGAEVPRVRFWDTMAALRAAVDRMEQSGLFDAEFGQWRELLDAYAERVRETADRSLAENTEEARQAFSEALREPEAVTQIVRHARECDPALARVLAQADAYALIFGTEAARLFLVGWKGRGLGRLKRDPTGATEESLFQIQEMDLVAIGRRVQELLEPRPDTVGNFVSPSSGRSSPDSATSMSSHPTAPSDGTTSEATAPAV